MPSAAPGLPTGIISSSVDPLFMHRAVPLFLLLYLVVAPASGAVRYVAMDGDDRGPGTADLPWATPGYGSRHLIPGDTLVIRNGTYLLSRFDEEILLPPSGQPGAWITIRGDGATVLAGRDNLYAAVVLDSVSHVRLADLEITSDHGVWFRGGISIEGACTEIQLEDLRIHHLDEFGINIQNVDRCAVRRCRLTHCGFGGIGGPVGTAGGIRRLVVDDSELSFSGHYYRGGGGEGNPYSRPDGLGLEASNGPVEVRNTTVSHNRGDGLDSKARSTAIHHCVVSNNSCDGIKLWGDGSTVESTLVSGTGDGAFGASPWAGIVISGRTGASFRIVNVVVRDHPGRLAYPIYAQYDDREVPVHVLVRNTVIAGGHGPAWFGPSVDLTLDHSIVFRPGGGDPVEARGRAWSGLEIEAGALGDGNLCRDPRLVEPVRDSDGDCRLLPDSPGIDAGTMEGAPATDLSWGSRPLGDGFDIGACERAAPVVLPGGAGIPRDLDRDGRFEDVNGNGRGDFADVVMLFSNLGWCAEHEPSAFDFNQNGRSDFADVVHLFDLV